METGMAASAERMPARRAQPAPVLAAIPGRRLPGTLPGFHRQMLISIVMILLSIGTVMVFSAGSYHRGVDGDAFFFLKRQLLWIPIAVLAGMVASQIDYRLLARGYLWVFGATVMLLVLVLIPAIGLNLNSSRRWLPLGSLQFQPSELAKLAAVVFLAGFFSRDLGRLERFWRGFVPAIAGILLLFLLILVEPDFGTAMFTLGLSGLVLMLSGVRRFYLLASAGMFLPVIAGFVAWRWDMIQHRLLGFLDPDRVHQIRHSLLALGSGGWTGMGLGAGMQKLKYLPEPYTDFILSVIGEELGFLGSLGVVVLFIGLLWASIGIARRARDTFGFLLGSGIALSLAMQAATNIAVVTASAPTKGIPLPFLTFGGSGLCVTLAAIGLLLSIDRIRMVEGPAADWSRGAAGEELSGRRPEVLAAPVPAALSALILPAPILESSGAPLQNRNEPIPMPLTYLPSQGALKHG